MAGYSRHGARVTGSGRRGRSAATGRTASTRGRWLCQPTRTAGLRGRLPKKPPAQRFNIQYLSAYLTSPLPALAYPVDVTGGITDWGMLGNGHRPST